jgi:hypothetical protein
MEERLMYSFAFAETRKALSLVHKQLFAQLPAYRLYQSPRIPQIFWLCDHKCVICYRRLSFQSDTTGPSWRYMQNHGNTKICTQCDKEMGVE